MKGFGPVVTGTLDAGRIAVEDALTLLPDGLDARVRRVEVHGEERREAFAGERTSLNLAGIDRGDLRRGQALVPKGALVAGVGPDGRGDAPARARRAPPGRRARPRPPRHRRRRREVSRSRPGSRRDGGAGVSRRARPRFAQLVLESPRRGAPGRPLHPAPPVSRRDARRRARSRRRAAAARSSALGAERRPLSSVLAARRREGDRGPLPPRGGARRASPPRASARGSASCRQPPRTASRRSPPPAARSGSRPALFAHARVASRPGGAARPLSSPNARRRGAASVALAQGRVPREARRGSPARDGRRLARDARGRRRRSRSRATASSPPGAAAGDLSGDAAGFAAKLAELYRKAGFEPPKAPRRREGPRDEAAGRRRPRRRTS